MSKRFIDTELWDKTSFNASSQKIKLLTIFITCKSDCIGVFKMAPMLINAYIGELVNEDEILSIPCDIIRLKDGSYFLEKFCLFQYGELKDSCKPHRKYIQMLKQIGLFERVSKGYRKGINTLQEKEEEQEKDKEEDKEKEKDKRDSKHLEIFDIFRKSYKGTKNGNQTEFDNFKKKHKDWKEVLPDLSALLGCIVNQREAARVANQFVPQWKNLSTWINQRCWEEEVSVETKKADTWT